MSTRPHRSSNSKHREREWFAGWIALPAPAPSVIGLLALASACGRPSHRDTGDRARISRVTALLKHHHTIELAPPWGYVRKALHAAGQRTHPPVQGTDTCANDHGWPGRLRGVYRQAVTVGVPAPGTLPEPVDATIRRVAPSAAASPPSASLRTRPQTRRTGTTAPPVAPVFELHNASPAR